MTHTTCLPVLEIRSEGLLFLVEQEYTKDTLIICDAFNYPQLGCQFRKELADSCQKSLVWRITRSYEYNKILAIGGCTALDIGRACARGMDLICFPTVLSTTCISCDRSKIQFSNGHRLVKTQPPSKTIISMPFILQSKEEDLIRWTQSGFGDLFANISASIDVQYQKQQLDFDKVRDNVFKSFEALDWVIQHFTSYNEKCLRRLSQHLHHSSIEVIQRNNTKLSLGSEHLLYHNIMKSGAASVLATHGQMVSLGTLINAKLFSMLTGNEYLYIQLKKAYRLLGLPTNFAQLAQLGISKSLLVAALQAIPAGSGLLGDYFSNNCPKVLDGILGD